MTPESEGLVRQSWDRLRPKTDEIATVFYERLFEQNPDAAALFAATNMPEQRRKFVAMLTEIVRVLDQPELLVSEVGDSGRRHVRYGVQARDYADVGAALLWAIEHGLGNDFTRDVRDAWREAYALLAAVMQRGAAPRAATRAAP